MSHPNAFYLGDRAYVNQGRFTVPVRVVGFKRDMVRVRYQDGTEGLRAFGSLRRTR